MIRVMAGLVPAIHDLPSSITKDVDARAKRGHDGCGRIEHRREVPKTWMPGTISAFTRVFRRAMAGHDGKRMRSHQ
jgi:hypothetical protein